MLAHAGPGPAQPSPAPRRGHREAGAMIRRPLSERVVNLGWDAHFCRRSSAARMVWDWWSWLATESHASGTIESLLQRFLGLYYYSAAGTPRRGRSCGRLELKKASRMTGKLVVASTQLKWLSATTQRLVSAIAVCSRIIPGHRLDWIGRVAGQPDMDRSRLASDPGQRRRQTEQSS